MTKLYPVWMASIAVLATNVAASASESDDERERSDAVEAQPRKKDRNEKKGAPRGAFEKLVDRFNALGETVLKAKRKSEAASEKTIRSQVIDEQPRSAPGDLLRLVPGLMTLQHAGGGKAQQILLRGFDADHGTDVAVFADGVPANAMSHPHVNGYADLNFIIPETIERIEITKGPYSALYGDYATAGAVDFVTKRRARTELTLSGGAFETLRFLGIASGGIHGADALAAVEIFTTNGYQSHNKAERANVFGKLTAPLGSSSTLTLTASAYAGDWQAPGLLPLREVLAGRLSPFGFSFDGTDGGAAQRQGMTVRYQTRLRFGEFALSTYLTHQRLAFRNNFTGYAKDPVRSDQFEQDDDRLTYGGEARMRVRSPFGKKTELKFGASFRGDKIRIDEWQTTAAERFARLSGSDVAVSNIGTYLAIGAEWTSWFRTTLGGRYDLLAFDLSEGTENLTTTGSKASGVAHRSIVSPKGSLVFEPTSGLDLFLSAGGGYHSPSAKSAVERGTAAVARSWGGELGTRVSPAPWLTVAAAGFVLTLDREFVFNGDDRGFEEVGATVRYGAEASARCAPWRPLVLDVDVAWSRARFRDGSGAVPNAPTFVGGASLVWTSDFGLSAGLKARALGRRPLIENASVESQGFLIFDLLLRYRNKRFAAQLTVENLMDRRWREAEYRFDGTSVDPTREPSPGVSDIYFTSGTPFRLMGTLTLYL